MAQLEKGMSRAEFEHVIDETMEVIKASGLASDRTKIHADLLERLAALNGTTVEETEKALKEEVKAESKPAKPAKSAAEVKRDVTTAARRIRDFATKGTYFWEDPKDAQFIEMCVQLKRAAGLSANLLITGPSGSGKSESVARAAERMGLPFYKIDCASITTVDRWIGHKEFTPGEGTVYVKSEFIRAIEATEVPPGIVLLDEINRLHPSLVNILFPILDGFQRIWVPEMNATIEVHPETVLMFTANIGSGFTGTHRMDDALVGRLGYRLERNWPPAGEEVTILEKRTGIAAPDAKALVAIAAQTRSKAKNDDLAFPVSTRNLLDTAALVAAGMTIEEAADYTFIKMYEESGGAQSQRLMVRAIVQGKAGK